MIARLQRIAAGIELFALVLWTGGLFLLVFFLDSAIAQVLSPDGDQAADLRHALDGRFGVVEAIFAIAVLVSNFLKVLLFRSVQYLQRIALLVAAILLAFTFFQASVVRPRIDRTAVVVAQQQAPASASKDVVELSRLRTAHRTMQMVNLGLALFLVYSYRTFEDRKMQALARILKAE